MACEKRLPCTKMDSALEAGFFPPRRSRNDLAFIVDDGGNTGVGHPNHVATGFNGPHRAKTEVVLIAGCALPPSVICNHGDEALFWRQRTGTVGTEDGLKA